MKNKILFLFLFLSILFLMSSVSVNAYDDAYNSDRFDINYNSTAVNAYSPNYIEYRNYNNRSSNEVLSDIITSSGGGISIGKTDGLSYQHPQYESMLYSGQINLHETQPRFWDLLHVYLEKKGRNNNAGVYQFVRHHSDSTYDDFYATAMSGASTKTQLPYKTVRQRTNDQELVNDYGDHVAVPISVVKDVGDRHPSLVNTSETPGPLPNIYNKVDSVTSTGLGPSKTYDQWVAEGFIPMKLGETNEIVFMDFHSTPTELNYDPETRIKQHLYITQRLGFAQTEFFMDMSETTYESKTEIDLINRWNQNQQQRYTDSIENSVIRVQEEPSVFCSILPPPLPSILPICNTGDYINQPISDVINNKDYSLQGSGSYNNNESIELEAPPRYAKEYLEYYPNTTKNPDLQPVWGGPGSIWIRDRSTGPGQFVAFQPELHANHIQFPHITKISFDPSVRVGPYVETVNEDATLKYSRKATEKDVERLPKFKTSNPRNKMIPGTLVSNQTEGHFGSDYSVVDEWMGLPTRSSQDCCPPGQTCEDDGDKEELTRLSPRSVQSHETELVELFGYDKNGDKVQEEPLWYGPPKSKNIFEVPLKNVTKNTTKIQIRAWTRVSTGYTTRTPACEPGGETGDFHKYYKYDSRKISLKKENTTSKTNMNVDYIVNAKNGGTYWQVSIDSAKDYGYWTSLDTDSGDFPEERELAHGSWSYISARNVLWDSTHLTYRTDTRLGNIGLNESKIIENYDKTFELDDDDDMQLEYNRTVDDLTKVSPTEHYLIPDPRSFSARQDSIQHGSVEVAQQNFTAKLYPSQCSNLAYYETCDWDSISVRQTDEYINDYNTFFRDAFLSEATIINGYTRYDINKKDNITLNTLVPNNNISQQINKSNYTEQNEVTMHIDNMNTLSNGSIRLDLRFTSGGDPRSIKPWAAGQVFTISGSSGQTKVIKKGGDEFTVMLGPHWQDSFYLDFDHKVNIPTFLAHNGYGRLPSIPYIQDRRVYRSTPAFDYFGLIIGIILAIYLVEKFYTKLLLALGYSRSKADRERLIPIDKVLYLPIPSFRWRRFRHILNLFTLDYLARKIFMLPGEISVSGPVKAGKSTKMRIHVTEGGKPRQVKWSIESSGSNFVDKSGKIISHTWDEPGQYKVSANVSKGPKNATFTKIVEVEE